MKPPSPDDEKLRSISTRVPKRLWKQVARLSLAGQRPRQAIVIEALEALLAAEKPGWAYPSGRAR